MKLRGDNKADWMEDRQLVQRVLDGDARAFDHFYTTYLPKLYRFALRRVGNCEADAEDAVQRTFIKALRNLSGFRGEAALFTWLCTICRREIHDMMHEKGRAGEVRPIIEDDAEIRTALEMLGGAGDVSPEHIAMSENIVQLVHTTLDYLPPRYGDVLERRYLRGESINEIAASLDLRRDAADSLLARARRAFRDGFAVVTAATPMQISELTPG